MRLSYDTLEELIEAAGLSLEQEQRKADADTSGDVMKTTPGDQSRQSNISIDEEER